MRMLKASVIPLALALILGACSTNLSPVERIALYESHAGPPVNDFRYFGSISWTPLGDQALAVWTKPNEAWLLNLFGPCYDLDVAPAISISNMMGRVSARFDKVHVVGGGMGSSMRMPCQIQSIRPLDVKSLKAAEKQLREAKLVEREAENTGS